MDSVESPQSLRDRMDLIRRDLQGDVEVAMDQAREWTDWRLLVGSHPWLSWGVSALFGYGLVPLRRKSASGARDAGAPTVAGMPSLLALGGNLVMRVALTTAAQYMARRMVSETTHRPNSGGRHEP